MALVAVLVGAAVLVFRLRGCGGRQAVAFDYVADQADKLGHDPARISSFVQGLRDESYPGCLRGPVGTLWSGAGNDVDRAGLLAALLRASGKNCRFAQRRGRLLVQVQGDGGWSDVEPVEGSGNARAAATSNAGPAMADGWTGSSLPDGLFHRLTVEVRFEGAGLTNASSAVTLLTADMTGRPLVLAGRGSRWRLLSPEKVLLEGTVPTSPDAAQWLVFTHSGPGLESAVVSRREIFARGCSGYAATDDPRNRHTIVISTGTISRQAFDKEVESARPGGHRLSDGDAEAGYLLGLSHMMESDRLLGELATHLKVRAYFDSPRILIGSTCYPEAGKSSVYRALDLRRDSVRVDGPDASRATFGVARSILEGNLEQTVLAKATGAPVRSAFDIMRQFVARHSPSTPERLRLYESSLERLVSQTRPGTKLTFRLDANRSISFTNAIGGSVAFAGIAPSLEAARRKARVDFPSLVGAKIEPGQFGLTALELETLLGPVAGSAVDYRPGIDLEESARGAIFDGARVFKTDWVESLKTNIITLEYQFLKTEGDVEYDLVDHWDEVAKRPKNQRERLRVAARAVEESDIFSNWYSQRVYDEGAMSLFFSRKMYRELATSGSTIIRYRKYDGSLSEPILLYVMDRFDQAKVFVNNESRFVTQLYLWGAYAKDHVTRAQVDKVPEMIDETDPLRFSMNRFAILDDPRFPLVEIIGARFQTAIPGRVTSGGTGLGIPDASVKVEGTEASGTSWGDGRILLPIIKEPFRIFTVTAEASGYAAFRGEFDFAQTNAFPLKIELTPEPAVDDYAWVTAKSLGALEKVDSPRLRDVVRHELANGPDLAALVPLSAVAYGASEQRAFLLFDNREFSFVGVGEDGLHASSSFLGGVAKDWFKSAWAATRGKAKPYQVPQGIVNYYFGHIAAWYVYSAGRLDAVADMINGKSFEDLGHAQAISRARQWIDGMSGLLKKVVVGKPGVDADMYRAGFMDALRAFDSNPAWRGQ